MKFKTHFNTAEFVRDDEINLLPSKTIPDQSMTVKELLDRYARGLPLDGMKVPIYMGDEIQPDWNKLDLAEIQELRENTQLEIDEIKERLYREQAIKNEKKLIAAHEKNKKIKDTPAPPPSGGGD